MKNEFKSGLVAILVSIPMIGLALAENEYNYFAGTLQYVSPSKASKPHRIRPSKPSNPRANHSFDRNVRVFTGGHQKSAVSPTTLQNDPATGASSAY